MHLHLTMYLYQFVCYLIIYIMIDEFKSLQLLIVGYYCKDFIGFAIMLDLNSLYW